MRWITATPWLCNLMVSKKNFQKEVFEETLSTEVKSFFFSSLRGSCPWCWCLDRKASRSSSSEVKNTPSGQNAQLSNVTQWGFSYIFLWKVFSPPLIPLYHESNVTWCGNLVYNLFIQLKCITWIWCELSGEFILRFLWEKKQEKEALLLLLRLYLGCYIIT